jgi:hypothetical protein
MKKASGKKVDLLVLNPTSCLDVEPLSFGGGNAEGQSRFRNEVR